MAKGLQNGLREAAFDEKYGDFNIEEEEQNPAGNKMSLFINKWLMILKPFKNCQKNSFSSGGARLTTSCNNFCFLLKKCLVITGHNDNFSHAHFECS